MNIHMSHFPYLNVTFLNASTVPPAVHLGRQRHIMLCFLPCPIKAFVYNLPLHRELQFAGILLLPHRSVLFTRPIIMFLE